MAAPYPGRPTFARGTWFGAGGMAARLWTLLARYRAPLVLLAIGLALRLPLISTSIDEIDSANFVNALQNGYDIPLLRPHAPGYPIYIFAGSLMARLTGDAVTGLALLSAILGALTVVPFYSLAREFAGPRLGFVTSLLLVVNPLFWTFSESALSDVPSVFFVTLLAWLAYRGRSSDRAFLWAAAVASLAIGMRAANVAFLPMLAFPIGYRLWVTKASWWRPALVGAEVFAAVTMLWAVPMVLIGTDGFAGYLSAVDKQWAGAVRGYDLFSVEGPWLQSAMYRIERFFSGYLLTNPWVGMESRTPLATALQAPWVLGLASFIACVKLNDRRHIFLLIWLTGILYPIATIHFLPRYGLAIVPPLVLAAVQGYRGLFAVAFGERRRTGLFALIGIGTLLMLIGIKHQPPVATFEWTPPEEGLGGAALLAAGALVLLTARVWAGRRHEIAGSVRTGILAMALGALVIATAGTGLRFAVAGHGEDPPNQRLVQYARTHYDMGRVAVCWDGQTHGYFEVLTPGVVPTGYWSADQLIDAHRAGMTVLATDQCVRFEEVDAAVGLMKVAEFAGRSPAWSKVLSITLYAGLPSADEAAVAAAGGR